MKFKFSFSFNYLLALFLIFCFIGKSNLCFAQEAREESILVEVLPETEAPVVAAKDPERFQAGPEESIVVEAVEQAKLPQETTPGEGLFGAKKASGAQKGGPAQPLVINGDTVEFSTDSKQVTATGNVEIDYRGSKLTCEKLTVNTVTKEGVAEGNVRLEDAQGIIEGSKLTYNFDTKYGIIYDAAFRSNPYFGKTQEVQKIGDKQTIAKGGYVTTCDLDKPHFKMTAKEINIVPQEKIEMKGMSFRLEDTPILYVPYFSRSLKDWNMHIQATPGKDKNWGPFLLTNYRFNLNQYLSGRLYLDYRNYLGIAEGFGTNYDTRFMGKGDFKFYFTDEDVAKEKVASGAQRGFERYLIRLRHKWDIGPQTNLTAEYYRIGDEKREVLGSDYNFVKDYFYREFEKDSQPLTYALFHHGFNYSSLDVLLQKRVNNWYDPGYIEKLPEAKFSLPAIQIGNSRVYFANESSGGNYNIKNSSSFQTTLATPDEHFNRIDTTNKLSLPSKISFIQITPFVSSRQTFYDKNISADPVIRTIFSSGADLSTKFYRLFNIKSDFLDLNGLRHVITPTIGYTYTRPPTIAADKLRQVDSVDTLARGNIASLSLDNKLQTKRNGTSVDLVDFLVTSSYIFDPKSGIRQGSYLSDILFDLKVLPYSWLSMETTATYKRSVDPGDTNYNKFTDVNFDLGLNFGIDRTFNFGQRYLRKGGNQLTAEIIWRLNPKWKIGIYERYERGHDPNLIRGFKEQQFTITRDLHCWETQIALNMKKNSGSTFWVLFRLKAFPELEFEINQTYHSPSPGSQTSNVH